MIDLEKFIEIRMPLGDWVDLYAMVAKFDIMAPWCGMKVSREEDRVIHDLGLALEPHFPDDEEVVD